MNIEKDKMKRYMRLAPGEKLRFLLEYKIFVEKATGNTEKRLLITIKKKEGNYFEESPPFMTNSE